MSLSQEPDVYSHIKTWDRCLENLFWMFTHIQLSILEVSWQKRALCNENFKAVWGLEIFDLLFCSFPRILTSFFPKRSTKWFFSDWNLLGIKRSIALGFSVLLDSMEYGSFTADQDFLLNCCWKLVLC